MSFAEDFEAPEDASSSKNSNGFSMFVVLRMSENDPIEPETTEIFMTYKQTLRRAILSKSKPPIRFDSRMPKDPNDIIGYILGTKPDPHQHVLDLADEGIFGRPLRGIFDDGEFHERGFRFRRPDESEEFGKPERSDEPDESI